MTTQVDPSAANRGARTVGETTASVAPPADRLWNVGDWWDITEWWLHPATAYLAGLQHGIQIAHEEMAAEDEAAWRQAVRRAVATIERADRRAAADRGELAT